MAGSKEPGLPTIRDASRQAAQQHTMVPQAAESGKWNPASPGSLFGRTGQKLVNAYAPTRVLARKTLTHSILTTEFIDPTA